MQEFNEIVNVYPVLLRAQDLLELENILKNDLACGPDDFRVNATCGSRTTRENSVASLLERDLPETTHNMSLHVYGWNEGGDIECSIDVRMNYNYTDYHIMARREALFLGKKAQLDQFFRKCRPWYSPLSRYLPVIAPLFAVLAFMTASWGAARGSYVAAAFALTLAVAALAAGVLAFRQRIFPYVRILLRQKQAWASRYEVIYLALTGLLLLATIASVVASFTSSR